MTKATSETTKLNFITDQGSTRATVRCACRAVRFNCAADAFCAGPRGGAWPFPAVSLPSPPDDDPVFGAGEFLAAVPDRRNVRAGDDGECGGGSGISHANAAGETNGGSADAGLPAAGAAEPAGEGAPEAFGSSPADFTANSAG